MKQVAPFHVWDEGLDKLKPESKETVNRVFRELGWPGLREAYDPETSYEERRMWAESIDRVRLYNSLTRELEKEMRQIKLQMEDLRVQMKKVDQLRKAEPVAFFTGRDFRGVPEPLNRNLKSMFKVLGRNIGTHLCDVATGKESMIRATETLGDAVHLWVQDRCHTFFLGDQLFNSLLETDVHGDFSLLETKWPMESFAVVFPGGVPTTMVKASDGKESEEEVIGIVMACPEKKEIVTADTTACRLLDWQEEPVTILVDAGVPTISLFTKDNISIITNADLLDGPFKAFLFTLLHVWVEKPELVERGHRLGNKVARNPNAKPAWSPNFIGRTYVVPERHEGPREGDGRRVRRKVRGHFKWQAHGKAFALRKRIFIEPYWAGSIEL